MPGFRTTNNLGPALDLVYTALPYYDSHLGVAEGNVANGDSGIGLASC